VRSGRPRWLMVLAVAAVVVAAVDTLASYNWNRITRTMAVNPEAGAIRLASSWVVGLPPFVERSRRMVPRDLGMASREVVIETLIAAGDDEELVQEQQLRSAIPTRTTVLGVENPDGILTIDLGPEGLFELEDEQQLQAIAQLVYTATGLGSVDGVLLQIEGELRPLPTEGEPTEGLRPVTREDYSSLA